ncbi:MAG: oligosaccharide flippase family protein [Bacteroidetes bacterium]|nr:oligosaccharide flippase family protein [Bacteroidota bacterium]
MKRFSKNILSLTIADLLRRIFGFITVAYLARVVGTETFGAINTAYAVLAYGIVVSTSGLTAYGIRSVAQGASTYILSTIISERLTLSVLVLTGIVLCTLTIITDPTVQVLVLLFSCTLIPLALSPEWFLQGKETMVPIAFARTIAAAIPMVIAIIAIHSSEQTWILAVGSIVGDCCATLILQWVLRSSGIRYNIQFPSSLHLVIQSFPLSVGIILSTLVINYPPLALTLVRSQYDVGIYSAASKLVFFLLIGDRLLNALIFPAVSRKLSMSQESLQPFIQQILRWILFFTTPFAVAGVFLAEDVLKFIFGEQYSVSTPVLQVLVWYFVLTMLHTVFTALLLALHKEKIYRNVMVTTAILYALFVTVGAYSWGAIGAAAGVVVAELLSLMLLIRGVQRLIPLSIFKQRLGSFFVSVAGLASIFTITESVVVTWRIVVAFLVFFSLATITGGITRNDFQTIKQLIL